MSCMARRGGLAPMVAVATLALGLGACGSSNDSASSGGSGSAGASVKVSDTGPGLQGLPADLRAAYKNSGQTTEDSPYFGFKPKQGPPWTIAYVSTYSGNTWRGKVMAAIKDDFAKYKALGLVDKLIVTESNFDVSRTGQQIRQAVDRGADAILTIAPSATGINPAIDAAFKAGVPVINFDSPVTTLHAINVGVNYYQAGHDQAEYVASKVGKGPIIYMGGIPGFAASQLLKQGALDVYKQKGVKILAQPDGMWTQPVAKAALLKTLSSTPSKIAYVHQQAGMGGGVAQALQQTGRGATPFLTADDAAGGVAWSKDPGSNSEGFSEFPPGGDARIAFDVMMRTLEGQGPKITSILRMPVTFSESELASMLPPNAGINTPEWFESVPPTYRTKDLPRYFARPADPTAFKPAS